MPHTTYNYSLPATKYHPVYLHDGTWKLRYNFYLLT